MTGSLAGIRLIDASEGIAGGYCSRLLAGLGVDVVKVERPGTGDVLRHMGPFPGDLPHHERSGLHLHLNACKRSVTLDIASATGGALLARLAARADALLVGDPRRVHAAAVEAKDDENAPLIVTITPFGAEALDRQGDELVALAASGYMSLNGDPDRTPIKLYGSQGSFQAGLHAAVGVVAALTPERPAARRLDVSIMEAGGFLMAGALQRRSLMDRPQRRAGPRPAGFGPNRLYPSTIRPCADGHVHVHCHNRFPDLLAVLMHEPRLAALEVLAEPLGHADDIDALMDAWLASRARIDAVAEAQELRIPMTEVLTPAEVLEDVHGHHAARDSFVEVDHPATGAWRFPGAPVRMPASPWRSTSAPLLGEHNAEIYGGALSLKASERARLVAAGVI